MTEKSIALGTFDGFHLGHTAVISKAAASDYPAYIMLFTKHPLAVITGNPPPEILTASIRERLTDQSGVTPLIVDFEEIVNISPEDFFYGFLIEKFNAKELSCGENYTFGKGGKGDISLLKRLCAENEIALNVANTVTCDGKVISSTVIRKSVENGDIITADKMLGRAFSYDFPVVSGDRRGRLLGFPTINQIFPDGFVKMKFGVYASAALVDGKYMPAVTNFGIRPTIGTDTLRSETCILGYSGNLYGKNVEVSILSYLRPEKKFASLGELSKAINNDACKSKEIFTNSLALLK